MMPSTLRKLFGIACLLSSIGVSRPSAAMHATALTCEYQSSPLGLDTLRPRLGWKCTASSTERGVRQTAYRVLVASEAAKLESGSADLWETGKIDSDRSTNIDYRGKALQSGVKCWWTVMLWDASGRATGWSKPDYWTMGLLSPSDWQAKWITAPDSLRQGQLSPLFRKQFTIAKPIKRATVYVTGLGFYELHLNGRKVGNHELDPGFTRYDKRVLYATYDVTRSLQVGANALGLTLGNGWFNYAVSAAWDFDKADWRAAPKALLQLVVEHQDGTTETVVSDASWRSHVGPLIDNQLMTGETYDARREVAGWDTTSISEVGWTAVAETTAPAGALSSETYPAVIVFQALKTTKLTQPKPGVYVFDFGQNMAGVEELTVKGQAGTTIKMQFGEELHADGTLSQDKIKIHTHQEGFQTDSYTLRGSGVEVWRPRFTYHGFRYAQVTGYPGTPTESNLRALVMHAGFDVAGTFECSNPVLNKIQSATQWAYISNFFSIPTDCPTREKNGWMGDAQLAAETGLYNYGAGPNYSKWIRDMQDAQRPSGELPGIVPTGGWGFAWGNGPAWDSAYPLISWDLYQFYGDRHILEEQYNGLKRYVDYVDSRSSGHIAAFGLNDWAPYKAETPTDITSTGYFYRDTLLLAQAAHILNRRTDEPKYLKLAADIRDAFNAKFYHADTGQVGAGTQTALSCALYQGLAPVSERPRILANLVASIESKGNHMDCGILGAKYIMHALTDGGRQDLAYKLAVQTTMPSWGFWVENGSTTLLEQWNDRMDGDLSRNHIMFGDISAWCYQALAGIKGDEDFPGFKNVVIQPYVRESAGLTFVKATHRTQYGDVISNWTVTGDQLSLDITIPGNCSATVFVPTRAKTHIMESGKPVENAECVVELYGKGNMRIFRIGSGQYHFSSTL